MHASVRAGGLPLSTCARIYAYEKQARMGYMHALVVLVSVAMQQRTAAVAAAAAPMLQCYAVLRVHAHVYTRACIRACVCEHVST